MLPAYDDLRPIPATNYGGPRPRGLLGAVLHTTVGTLEAATARFKNPASIVSATFGIGLDGQIILWVATNRIAYHAGNWPINQERVGFEHEDNGAYWDSERTPELYLASGTLLGALGRDTPFPIDTDHVGPHRDFTATACPDALDVGRIIAIAQGEPMDYWTREEQQAYMTEMGNTIIAIKNLLNPIGTWVQAAPGAKQALAKHVKEIDVHLKRLTVLQLKARPPKRSRRRLARVTRPAGAPTRTAVLAGHGKGR